MSRQPPAVERLLRARAAPLVAALDAMGVSPDALTYSGLILGLGAAAVVATGHLGYGAAAFLLSSLFDVLDGQLARRRAAASPAGAFLDSSFDRIGETALFLALLHDWLRQAYGPPWLGEIILVALGGSLTTSYCRSRAESLGAEAKVGWLERPERVILLTLGMVVGRAGLGFVLFALAALTWITVLQRIVHARRLLAEQTGEIDDG